MRQTSLDFGTAIEREDLDGLQDISNEFRLWIKKMLSKGKLAKIVDLLIKLNLAKNKKEALVYLNDLSKTFSIDPNSVARLDFTSNGRSQALALRELEKLWKESGDDLTEYNIYHEYGKIGHLAIPYLFSGRNFRTRKDHQEQPHLFQEFNYWHQLEIFSNAGNVLFERNINEKLLNEIESCWQIMKSALQSTDIWFEQYRLLRSYLAELQNLLLPIFGEYLYKFDRHTGPGANYLLMLTLMSWASAVVFMYKNETPRCLFSEIPVLASYHNFGKERLDALEVVSINGKKPKVLEYRKTDYSSVGRIARDMVDFFGKDVRFRVIDWKFAVGDALSNHSVLKSEDVKENPLSKHAEQVRRYLVKASLDYYLVSWNRGKPCSSRIWPADGYFNKGALVYFMPDRSPIIHEIIMTSSEQEEFFMNDVVFNWNPSQKRSIIRQLDNAFAGYLVDALRQRQGNGLRNQRQKKILRRRKLDLRKTVIDVIDRYQKNKCFVDETEIIERAGRTRGGEPFYLMHLDKLVSAIESGQVQAGRFDWDRGGKISCLSPRHNEREPSMHVFLKENSFRCFGCGMHGKFDEFSIPDSLSHIEFLNPQRFRRYNKQTQKLIVPDEHHWIMGKAQELLQAAFRGSDAEDYLALERFLDPDLAFSLGAGFATDKLDDLLINGLLDTGFSYDQLIHYGFVGISVRISSLGGLCPLLKKRGMPRYKMLREKRLKKEESAYGLPYSVLADRITFPLELEGGNTNFYGRVIKPCSKEFIHRKLSNKNTGVPQGGFNMSVLESDAKEIFVNEGVMDSLSLIQIGFLSSLAVISADSIIIMEAISRTGKSVAVALDGDIPGLESTGRIFERLARCGHKAGIRDFTAEFINTYPDTANFKDFNDWWLKTNRTKYK